ncbi:MAG TPA: tRNA (adenosine(37)-N6)-threonylcarbamoyltransferase complex ATPase subunit type 1 TsaE [Phycisphaerae bacterium]|nr:tRNA (adenosine(37)-N6)-threonylcarbamoyltransferase complex ATPase subunit type 1 TsaE [Phycisphaerae bacterium]
MTAPPTNLELRSSSPDDTLRIGRDLAACLSPGDVVALVGPLGAGKTQLVKGIALGLGVPDSRLVNSPTFVLVNEYAGRFPIHHLDAYRLTSASELEALGFDEMCAGNTVVLVEWADRVTGAIPAAALWIELSVVSDNERRLTLRTTSADLAARLANRARLR